MPIQSTSLADDPQSYIIVGTTFADPQEPEPNRGRILVFSVMVREKRKKKKKGRALYSGLVHCVPGFQARACV